MGIRRCGGIHEEIGWGWRDAVKGRLEGIRFYHQKVDGNELYQKVGGMRFHEEKVG